MGHPFYVIKSFLKDPNQSEEDLQQSKIIKLVLVIKNILKAIKIFNPLLHNVEKWPNIL